MSWKKHFTVYNNTNGKSSKNSRGSVEGYNTRFQSWLPEVYSGMPNRIERYMQYDQMDMDVEINMALDTIAEFSTQIDEETELPFTIKYKKEPTDTETKVLNKALSQWCNINEWDKRIFKTFRNVIKYGDQPFIRDPETWELMYVNPQDVTGVVINESEGKNPAQYILRNLDLNLQDKTATTPIAVNRNAGSTTQSPFSSARTGASTSYNTNVTSLNTTQEEYHVDSSNVIHVALSEGMDANYPFGNSILDSVFKTYKQKELLEDALIIYRVQRAPERRVFYIDTGDMPPHRAAAFLEKMKMEVHQKRIPNKTGGGSSIMDAQYNPMSILEDYFFNQTCLSLDTNIPLLDGRELTLNEIIDEYHQGKENWVYGLSDKTHEFEAAKITWAGITRKNAKVLKVILNNEESVITTPDHRFITRDGEEVEAKDLSIGDSLMPLTLTKEQYDYKIIDIIELEYTIDTGDITIESDSNSHWFGLSSGIYVHNSEGRGSKVEVLPGGQCIALDTKIKLLDGRDLELSEIIKEYEQGKENWVYSVDPITGKIVGGPITWAGVTRKNAEVVKVTLDNGESVITTPDHKFLLRNGEYKEAALLNSGDSLMPHYERKAPIINGKNDYTQVFDNEKQKWEFVHRKIANQFKTNIVEEFRYKSEFNELPAKTIHHKDHNRHNNNPDNLCFMNSKDHYIYHSDCGFTKENQIKGTIAAKERMEYLKENNPESVLERNKKFSESLKKYINSLPEEEKMERFEILKKYSKYGSEILNKKIKEDSEFRENFGNLISQGQKKSKNEKPDIWRKRSDNIKRLNSERMKSDEYKENILKNQRIKYSDLMFDIIISYMNKNNYTRNELISKLNNDDTFIKEFKKINEITKAANFENNGEFKLQHLIGILKYNNYKNWKEFKKDLQTEFYNHKVVSVELLDYRIDTGDITVDGDEIYHNYHNFSISAGIFISNSLGEIEDLLFFSDKLMRGLRVPNSYMPQQSSNDSGMNFTDGRVGTAFIQEFRFNKYCLRLQNTMQPVFDREFKRFMKNRGFNIDSSMFELQFPEPQSFSDYRQIELDSAKAGVFAQLEGVDYLSRRFILKKYLGLSDSEILENERLYQEENPEISGSASEGGMDEIGLRGGDDFDEDIDLEDMGDDFGDDEGGLESPISGAEGAEEPPEEGQT